MLNTSCCLSYATSTLLVTKGYYYCEPEECELWAVGVVLNSSVMADCWLAWSLLPLDSMRRLAVRDKLQMNLFEPTRKGLETNHLYALTAAGLLSCKLLASREVMPG